MTKHEVCHLTRDPRRFRGQLRYFPRGGREHSFEGVALSVTDCDPETLEIWSRIAKLGGTTAVTLQRKDGQPGKFLTPRSFWSKARAWGVRTGLLAERPGWKRTYFDEEADMKLVEETTIATEAAQWRAEGQRVQAAKLLRAGPKLQARLRRSRRMVPPDVEAMNLYLAAKRPDADGIWFDDPFTAYTAPRGSILPHALRRWKAE